MREGFWFPEYLQKTADLVTADPVDLNWHEQQRRIYGTTKIVVQMDRNLFLKYKSADVLPECLFSSDRFYDEEEERNVYILQPQFVKGYMDTESNIVYRNPIFNPSYDNEELAKLNMTRFLED